jgi:hypothetical protein
MAARKTSGANLALLAKEINTRLSKADKMEGQSDDHRLAACIQLAEARKACKAQGLQFAKWARENVPSYAYETVRKYATIGGSSNPQQALADWRAKARKGMAGIRAQGKPRTITDETPEGRHRRAQKTILVDKYDQVPEKDRSEAVSEILSKDLSVKQEVLRREFSEMSASEGALILEAISNENKKLAMVILRRLFRALPERNRQAFIGWAEDEMGLGDGETIGVC